MNATVGIRNRRLAFGALAVVAGLATLLPQPARAVIVLPLSIGLPAAAVALLGIALGLRYETAVGVGAVCSVALWSLATLALLWMGVPLALSTQWVVLVGLVAFPLGVLESVRRNP